MRSMKKFFLLFLPFLFLLTASEMPSSVSAASRPAEITSCQLASANRVKVTVSVANKKKISGTKCYLFALSFSESGITKKAKPLASAKKASKMSFSVKLQNAGSSTLLYSRFVLASKAENGVYKVISNAKYISNPKKAAKYTYKFPSATSKKGLQVSANMLEDAIDLNVRHSVLNIVFSDLIPTAAERNNTFSVPYKYHGKTYWFRKALVNSYDAQLTALQENNVIVSAVLLLGWRDDLKSLILPAGREPGHGFYAWNTANAAAREQLQATLSFLGSRYGTSSAEHGRIVNWIVGNEVNNYEDYNYAGRKTLTQYAKLYANAFRLTYNTITSIYANARVYISLDHLWNTRVSGSFTSKEMLDAFASTLKKQGNIGWNLAFHPYGSPLTEPRFWADINHQAFQSLNAPVISMNNIGILTSYIRQNYGSGTRIILSEQGYTSVRHLTPELPGIPGASEGDSAGVSGQTGNTSGNDSASTGGQTGNTSGNDSASNGEQTENASGNDSASVDGQAENASGNSSANTDGQTGNTSGNDSASSGEQTENASGTSEQTPESETEIRIDAQKEQSAAIAYSYYLAESDDMIDSFIMNRHVDHQVEIDQGLDLGLWTTDSASSLPEWADEKKDSWNVFKYMDSNKAAEVTADALSVIGISQWSDVISGYRKKLYRKNIYSTAALNPVESYQKTAAVPANWNAYGAVTTSSKAGNTFMVFHNGARNRNSLWGFSQTFRKKRDLSASPNFFTTLNVHGATAGEAQVTIRFYSEKYILESSRVIPCDTPVNLGVSLRKWKRRNAVQKIQILISPVKGKWTRDASLTMKRPVCGN